MNRNYPFLFVFGAALFLSACSKEDQVLSELLQGVNAPSSAPGAVAISSQALQPQIYNYPYAQERDPFVPVKDAQANLGKTQTEQETLFSNLGRLQLRGIVKDAKDSWALLVSDSGASYFLRKGRLYDKRNRVVQGVTGSLKDKIVILLFANGEQKQLSLTPAAAGGLE